MLNYLSGAPLGRYCTFLTGGRARRLAFAYDAADLQEAAQAGVRILGRGSNVLVGDKGYDGDIVVNRSSMRVFDGAVCRCDSGVLLSLLAREYADVGRTGLEWAYGLPGTLGGAVVGNAGAFGGCMADVVESVTVYSEGCIRTLTAQECGFGYRFSTIRGTVLSLVLRAPEGDFEEIRAASQYNLGRRRASQPLGASAGSVFKAVGTTPAAVLIESAKCKGKESGGAQVSVKHANFIVNRGGATSADILYLMNVVQAAVYEKFGVRLEREIQLLGDFY